MTDPEVAGWAAIGILLIIIGVFGLAITLAKPLVESHHNDDTWY